MKATINGIQVEGTPSEILEFWQLQLRTPQVKKDNPHPWIKTHIGGNTLYCGDGQLPPQQHQNSIHQTMASYLQAYAAEQDGGE